MLEGLLGHYPKGVFCDVITVYRESNFFRMNQWE